MNKRIWMSVIGLAMLALPAHARASGFANGDLSASAAGVGNAFTATANDASAMAFNPSGIAWQDGVSLMAGGSLIRSRNNSLKTTSVTYPNSTKQQRAAYQVYATVMPHTSNLGFGLSYVTAFDANNDWSLLGTGFGVTNLNIQRASADAIYAVSSNLAVAIGGDWYIGKAALSQGTVRFDGRSKGDAFGGHASLMWRPWYGWSFGVMGRSGPKVKFNGNGGTLSLQLPDEVMLGVAHDFTDSLRLEVDADWMHWSKLKNLNVIGGTAAQTNALNLRDSVSAMAGLTWAWRENATVRFGYTFDGAASKSSGFNPALADEDGHRISLGGGFDAFGFHTDASYSYTFYPNKTFAGLASGTLRDRRQALLVSVSKVF
ncbi:MAG TPA: outer membrane protein transport protein [Mariprofundaceae bacterium]|nr:outer membrane protein transport protein [Mariprofundaceae bacterium]